MSLKEDLEVDKYTLDVDLEGHALIVKKWNKKLRNALTRLNKAEEQFRYIKADLFRKVRAGDEEIKIEGKPTDGAVTNTVILQPEFMIHLKERNEAKTEVDMLYSIKFNLNDRLTAMKEEVKLWLNGYYSSPNIPKEFTEQVETRNKDSHKQTINKSMKRRSL